MNRLLVVPVLSALVLVTALCLLFVQEEKRHVSGILYKIDETNRVAAITRRTAAVLPLDQVCPEYFPAQHAVLHDRRPEHVEHYEKSLKEQVERWNRGGSDIPKTATRQNCKFAVWLRMWPQDSESSVWDDAGGGHVEGPGWVKPIMPDKEAIPLEGDWVASTSWFIGNFGHFVHDHLPTIAYLKSVVPPTTRFLLVNGGVEQKFLAFLDPEFYTRITWITRDDVYHIKGSLTVVIPIAIPVVNGCCMGWDPLREWLANVHPDDHSDPKKKLIVFYTRGGTTNTHHGRVVEPNHEAEIIEHIQTAMVKYKRPEKFLIFSGQIGGKTLDYMTQFMVFRAASTIIGPHGSGLGGNLVFTNPFASSCNERTQLLEFIPGQESAQVQSLYVSYFPNYRKWPLDYHSILYTAKSTGRTTYINLQDLDDALDAMWGNDDRRDTQSHGIT